jgi:hypothetical protein
MRLFFLGLGLENFYSLMLCSGVYTQAGLSDDFLMHRQIFSMRVSLHFALSFDFDFHIGIYLFADLIGMCRWTNCHLLHSSRLISDSKGGSGFNDGDA